MNWPAIRAIARKDLDVARRAKAVVLPLVIVPAVLLLIQPLVFVSVVLFASAGEQTELVQELLKDIPAAVRAQLAGYTPEQQAVIVALRYFMAPMFLLIPLMSSSVIAADSLAGEKERKTLEALVHSPTTDRELFVAKTLAPSVAALAVTMGGFLFYSIVANAVAWPVMGRLFFPDLMWVILAFWVAPACAVFGLAAMVILSSRVATTQEAFQMGGLILLPFIAVMVGQMTGVMYFGPAVVVLLGLVLWLISALLLWVGARTLSREAMLTRT